MTFCLTRNYRHTRQKPPGLFRVLCIGDSQTFGAGVFIQEALPARLEPLLNRAAWNKQVEVVNDGVSGYALYDEWHHYILRSHHYEPDLLLIILSENDAELFSSQCGPGGPGPYEEHIRRCWDTHSIHLPHFRRVFQEIRAQLDEKPLPVIVVYYQVYGSPHREQRGAIIRQECEKNGLDFVDLSAEFSQGPAEAYDPKLMVSAADFHPSAAAHQMAAQKLARHIVRGGYLGEVAAPPLPEPEVYRRLLENAEHLRRAGGRPDFILNSLDQLLTVKRTSKNRIKLPAESLMNDREFSVLQQNVRALAGRGDIALSLEGANYALRQNAEMFHRGRNTAAELVNLLSKQLFVLENRLDDPGLWNFAYESGPDSPQPPPRPATSADQFHSWLVRAGAAREALKQGFAADCSKLPGFAAALAHRFEQASTSNLEYLQHGEEMISSWLNLYAYYQSLRVRHETQASQPTLHVAFTALAAELVRLAVLIDKTAGMTHPDIIPRIFSRQTPLEALYCAVKMSSTAPVATTIGVQWQSFVPEFQPMYDVHYLVRDGQPHTYRFCLPLSVAGQLKLVVCPPTEVELAAVECYVDEDRPVCLSNAAQHISNGQLWISFPDFVSLF
jgi:lysophospholipase L1-like esterase